MTETFTTPGGLTLSYERRGSGRLLVCHPGGPGGSAAEGWDVVVANPPYVESLEDVQPELRWEPEVALVGAGEHERLARAASSRVVVFEVGDDQADEVAAMLERLGCADVAITADLTGRDRVVEARLP